MQQCRLLSNLCQYRGCKNRAPQSARSKGKEQFMSEEILRDRYGNRRGAIVTESNGKQVAKDRYGNKLGEYDPSSNTTRDRYGNKLGQGNFLASLIEML